MLWGGHFFVFYSPTDEETNKLRKKVSGGWKQAISVPENFDMINSKLKNLPQEENMKNHTEKQKGATQGHGGRNWLCYELTEDDFLLGKTHEFSPEAWEDEEYR